MLRQLLAGRQHAQQLRSIVLRAAGGLMATQQQQQALQGSAAGNSAATTAVGLSARMSAQARRSSSSSSDGGQRPGHAYLASLIDYEKQGVPKAAGVAGSSGSGAAAAGFDLGVMRRLLAALGNPQARLRVVHVAGTKGKGSVVALLSSVLRAAGYRVGSYTSPHLFDIRERVVVGGGGHNNRGSSSSRSGGAVGAAAAAAGAPAAAAADEAAPVSEAQWEVLALQVQAAAGAADAAARAGDGSSGGCRPSHFEAVTAMALAHFAAAGVDIAVIETGLGGATDATNVFDSDTLQAAVITSIGLDHVEALGGSLTSIATAKAGILKPGVPAVVAAQHGGGGGGELPSEQQQGAPAAAAGGGGTAAAAAGSEVWRVLRQVAGSPGMACPLVAAEQGVQVCSAGEPCIGILPGPGLSLARQSLSIKALPGPGNPLTALQGSSSGSQAGSLAAEQALLPLDLPDVPLQLVGRHQAGNVQAAVTAALLLRQRGWQHIDADAIRSGLQRAWLPGRFQVLQLPGRQSHVVLDGAHTADSAAALAATLEEAFPGQPLVLVVAMAADKQHRDVLAALRACRPRVVVFTSVPIAGSHQRAAPPGTLVAHWQAAAMLSPGRPFRCRELLQANLGAALDKAHHELGGHGGRGVVVVTGSLHAVAAATAQLQQDPAW